MNKARSLRNGKFHRCIESKEFRILDSDVSKEYLRLFESGCLTAEELDSIRQNGLAAR